MLFGLPGVLPLREKDMCVQAVTAKPFDSKVHKVCVSLTVGFPTVAAEVCFSIVFATVSLLAVL
jgi:hypothetical protein